MMTMIYRMFMSNQIRESTPIPRLPDRIRHNRPKHFLKLALFATRHGTLRGSGAQEVIWHRKGGPLFWRLPLPEVLESLVFRRSAVGDGKVNV